MGSDLRPGVLHTASTGRVADAVGLSWSDLKKVSLDSAVERQEVSAPAPRKGNDESLPCPNSHIEHIGVARKPRWRCDAGKRVEEAGIETER